MQIHRFILGVIRKARVCAESGNNQCNVLPSTIKPSKENSRVNVLFMWCAVIHGYDFMDVAWFYMNHSWRMNCKHQAINITERNIQRKQRMQPKEALHVKPWAAQHHSSFHMVAGIFHCFRSRFRGFVKIFPCEEQNMGKTHQYQIKLWHIHLRTQIKYIQIRARARKHTPQCAKWCSYGTAPAFQRCWIVLKSHFFITWRNYFAFISASLAFVLLYTIVWFPLCINFYHFHVCSHTHKANSYSIFLCFCQFVNSYLGRFPFQTREKSKEISHTHLLWFVTFVELMR